MAEISWIKLSVNYPKDDKVAVIRGMPDGYTILFIWTQLMCRAGEINDDGAVYLTESVMYSPETLASALGHSTGTISRALSVLGSLDMVEIHEDGLIEIINWEKYQNIDGMRAVREKAAERAKRYRERKKLEAAGTDTSSQADDSAVTLPSRDASRDVTQQSKSKSKSKKDLKNIMSSNSADGREIVSYLNSQTGKRYRASTQATQTLINARLNEGFTVDDFKTVIDTKVSQWSRDAKMSAFLRPQTLFGTKFESYLNERGGVRDGQPDFSAYR